MIASSATPSGPPDARSWARLRQVIIATDDLEGDTQALRSALRLGQGFHDPELAEYSMVDHTFTLADGSYLQLIASLDPFDSLTKWTQRIGGRGGYALSIQHPDPAGVKARAEALGVGVIRAQEALGHPIVQLHPRDTGALLEADGISDPDVWFWDDLGDEAEPAADAAVDAILSVEVPVADPAAMGALWHQLLDLPCSDDPATVDLQSASLRFTEGTDSARWTIELRSANADRPATALLPGITFRYREPATSSGPVD